MSRPLSRCSPGSASDVAAAPLLFCDVFPGPPARSRSAPVAAASGALSGGASTTAAQITVPVAGGPCADPRPQVCTRDYRPACGLRRDGGRKTYGNACSACSDPEVVTQAAGACP